MEFNLPKEESSILKVIGVGGGGSNAVNHMYSQGIKGVDFIVCNTDLQALESSPVPTRVQIGVSLTSGRGAGSQPEVGKNAAIESIDELINLLEANTAMVFITAGMGGGTGTGAAPVIARAAKEMGILTVGIVTIPFSFEGPLRKKQAEAGLEQMREAVDTLLVIKNDKLRDHCGNLSVTTAFHESDNILTTAAKGIAEVISQIGHVNVDLNDVNTVMKDSGVAIMGSASASGENRASEAVTQALESPLLNENDISGARHVLLNITFGTDELTMDEMDEITNHIQTASGGTAEVIMGFGQDDTLGENINVTVIATGFKGSEGIDPGFTMRPEPKKYIDLDDEEIPTILTPEPLEGKPIEEPLTSPTQEFDLQNTSSQHPTNDGTYEEPYLKSSESINEPPVNEKDMIDRPIQHDLGFQLDEIKGRTEESASMDGSTGKKTFYTLDDTDDDFSDDKTYGEPAESRISVEEHQRITQERMQRVQEHNLRLRTPSGLSELEKEPAYKRRKLRLEEVPHSSDSQMSRYTLSDSNVEGIELKKNNPYLDKNVD